MPYPYSDFVYSESHKAQPQFLYFLYISLFLMMLAFFIVLNSISTKTDKRTEAMMNSLHHTFDAKKHSKNKVFFEDAKGREAAFAHIRTIALNWFHVGPKDISEAGDIMVLHMATTMLFAPGSEEIAPDNPFILKLAEALKNEAAGKRLEMLFQVGTPPYVSEKDAKHSLPIARAVAFAQALTAEGIDADVIFIGVTEGAPEQSTLQFHYREAQNE